MLDLEQEMSRCRVCPRKCGADREHGKTGYCKAPSGVAAARAALHFWEEPCISGTTGSGTVFFSGCNLRCVYCQNHHIAEMESGKVISIGRLSDIFLELQAQNANNINLDVYKRQLQTCAYRILNVVLQSLAYDDCKPYGDQFDLEEAVTVTKA